MGISGILPSLFQLPCLIVDRSIAVVEVHPEAMQPQAVCGANSWGGCLRMVTSRHNRVCC